jgi:hypothetical protein
MPSSHFTAAFTAADGFNEPLPAELKIVYSGLVWRSSGEYRMKIARIATVNAYQTGERSPTGGDRCACSGNSFFLQQW